MPKEEKKRVDERRKYLEPIPLLEQQIRSLDIE